MKAIPKTFLAVIALLGALAGCASSDLAYYDFSGRTMAIAARISPDAEVDASYGVVVDAEDPVRTALSIGSSLAKAHQVSQVEDKLYAALRNTDMRQIVEEELSDYMDASLGVRVVENRDRAEFQMLVDVERYGIDASGSNIEFELAARATLWDLETDDRIWRTREWVRRPASPEVFGLPPVAGNVLSAVMLAELSEEEIARGMEQLARDAAWDIARELEKDIYRANKRR